MARYILRKALPIKCLEAVVLGSYLTRDIEKIVRFPLRFKSKYVGQIVLCKGCVESRCCLNFHDRSVLPFFLKTVSLVGALACFVLYVRSCFFSACDSSFLLCRVGGHTFWHIVLGIRTPEGKFGALG